MFRFAPSPTGDMHVGNLRAALVNFVSAKRAKKGFILRIEDTDTARNIAGKDEEIKAILRAFGLAWDAEYVQSANYGHHRQLAAHLLRAGRAFACVCTPDELEREREEAAAQKRAYRYSGKCECNCAGGAEGAGGAAGAGGASGEASGEKPAPSENPLFLQNGANAEKIELLCAQLAAGAPLSWDGAPCTIRLKKPSENISFCDEIKGELSFAPADVDSFVIMRADCSPVYNFACCCDDICEGVSMIIRGEDHVSNTPKQEHIRASIGVSEAMKYAHLPIILNDEGKKMSKRDAASSVAWLLEQGYLPAAIANYLLLLGNKTPREVFTLAEAAEFFELQNLSRAPARFDESKLAFLNREHIKMLSDEDLARLVFCDEFLSSWPAAKLAALGKLCKLYLEEADTIAQLSGKLAGFFLPERVIFKHCEEFAPAAQTLKAVIKNRPAYEQIKELSGLGGKQLFKPLRLLLSGAQNGPELGKIYEIVCEFMDELLELRAK